MRRRRKALCPSAHCSPLADREQLLTNLLTNFKTDVRDLLFILKLWNVEASGSRVKTPCFLLFMTNFTHMWQKINNIFI